jgi:hypothetical protein
LKSGTGREKRHAEERKGNQDHPECDFSSVHFPFRITFIKPTKPSPAAMICVCSSGDRFTPAAVAIKISPLQVEFWESESTIVDSIFMVF